jgi:phenylacetic acid degradation operon negative regulatory protein
MPPLKTTESLPVRTQFVFFTLLGDYILPNGGKIWMSHMLQLMELLDVSERAVRSTLSRMTRKGWISPKRIGRQSQYTITPRGRALLEAGYTRIFEPTFSNWDHTWHLIVYSLPEKKRKLRHELRKQLLWLGFGRLAPGTWISPHDRKAELTSLFKELKLEVYAEHFSGQHFGPSSSEEMLQRCWDLEELKEQYSDFVSRYAPEHERHINQFNEDQCPDPSDCFVQRFWITHEFQALPFKDPNLPLELLPPDWIGTTARNLVADYRKLLAPRAIQYVRDVINGKETSPNGTTQ